MGYLFGALSQTWAGNLNSFGYIPVCARGAPPAGIAAKEDPSFIVMPMPTGSWNEANEISLRLAAPEAEIGALAATLPSAARIFLAHGIDFCCSGPRSLARAGRDHFLDPAQVIEEIRSAVRIDTPGEVPGTSPEAVIHYIAEEFLRPLGQKLSAIEALLDKIICFHGQGKGRDFRYLRAAFAALSGKLWENRFQKEQVWFPGIISGHSHSVELAVQAMQRENAVVRAGIDKLRALQVLLPAAGARHCISVRALHTALHVLLRECSEQLRLEAAVLYCAAEPMGGCDGQRWTKMPK